MRTRPSRRRRLLVPILLAGALSFGAAAAAGLQPSLPRKIVDSAFQPVTLTPATTTARDRALAAVRDRARAVAPIADPWLLAEPPAERARPVLPATKPVAVERQSASSTGHAISGSASWYCDAGVSPCTADHPDTTGFNAYAAAGPRLRAAIGSNWRGMVVTVDGIRVKLVDWCQCYQGESNEKLLDLYHDVFLRTGSAVTIRW